jgi:hypothetical protein
MCHYLFGQALVLHDDVYGCSSPSGRSMCQVVIVPHVKVIWNFEVVVHDTL